MRSDFATDVDPFTARQSDVTATMRLLLGQRRGHIALLSGAPMATPQGVWGETFARTLEVGDRVLALRSGPAATAWIDAARERGLEVEVVEAANAIEAPTLDLARRLDADRDGAIKAVFVRATEPETGVTVSMAGVRDAIDAADHSALLFVDVSDALPALNVRMEDWGIDVLIGTGGVLTDLVVRATGARVARHPARHEAGPSAVRALGERLDALFDEGLNVVQARYGRHAEATRRALRAWGVHPGAAKGVRLAVDATAVADDNTLLARIDATERRLRAAGIDVPAGVGVSAAASWLSATGASPAIYGVV